MLRHAGTRVLRDKTKRPHKMIKYGYVPDPRKLAPIDGVSRLELFPWVIRPPSRTVPDVGTFLDKCDIHEGRPTSEFKQVFESWDDLMSVGTRSMKARGIPMRTARFITRSMDQYVTGINPQRFDAKGERQYWRQFATTHKTFGSHIRIPDLPDRYRPHQLGTDVQPAPDYQALNRLPAWAVEEEKRLKSKTPLSSQQP